MDNNQIEIAALKSIEQFSSEIVVLDELQLTAVGGGVGEITPY